MQWIRKRKSVFILLGLAGLIALSFWSGYFFKQETRSPEEQLLDAAYGVISNDSLFNQQSDRDLTYTAIRGMLDTIDDPYAELIEPEAAAQFNSTFSGQTGVVGMYAEKVNDQVVVSIVFPGGAAEQAGLQAGDVLLSIDGLTLDKETDSSETGLMLRGTPGTSVQVTVQRGNQTLEYTLVRQVRKYVSSRMLPDNIGYISLSAFNQAATAEMKTALEGLLALDPKGLIWDLRNNEGGDMLAAQDILSFFINDGLLFTAELTNNRTVEFRSKGDAFAANLPLIVLIDNTTYSAAETCASTIAETGRGQTIGTSTYGKGVIQATVPLRDDVLLQLTIARWRSYHGEWYQGRGVTPLIEAVDNSATPEDELMDAAYQFLLNQ